MSYIGNEPAVGQWRKLTDISSSFDGVTTTFTTSVPPGTSAYYVTAGSASQLIISLGGVIQEPDVDYTVSTNSITFTTAPASGLSFFGVLCGDALNVGTPGDGSVTTSKLGTNLSVDLTSGSAATPSLTFDANTGLYSPGEDQVAISTGGTGRLFVDSSGRVGIGTTTFHGTSYITPIQVKASGSLAGGYSIVSANSENAGGIILASSSDNSIRIDSDPDNLRASSYVGFNVDGTERGRWDSSGRFLVGTSTTDGTINARLQIAGQNQALQIHNGADSTVGPFFTLSKSRNVSYGSFTIVQNGDVLGGISFRGDDGTDYATAGAEIKAEVDGTPGANDMPGRLVFSTTADGASSPTERMRIQANGKVLLGTTSTLYGNYYQLEIDGGASEPQLNKTSAGAGGGCLSAWNSATSGNNAFIFFFTEASITNRGSIDYNRSAGQVRYNVTSDRRLKSNIQDSESALSTLDQIKVRSYTWTETGYGVEYGFVAQELNEVAPDAVKVGDDGDEVVDTWAVDNAKLVPLLTKALQEAIAKIETLEAKVAALEAS